MDRLRNALVLDLTCKHKKHLHVKQLKGILKLNVFLLHTFNIADQSVAMTVALGLGAAPPSRGRNCLIGSGQ